ncbi:hypothetical protein [Burkholderia vietnamiensis]|uniref:hypothetical protein n=1 Tax=Burkholderia vietnamiensis TaxID=60552 RepID=UPI00075E3BD5|nr:hypothetical protein [Burkholderia vietnamiensis]KVR84122.1 hypothetical protein WK26_08500 [Burkholderia vietnamiensis]HDR9028602.1 hypothetical protein [Burkholderia vietnamiensis]
MHPIALPVLLLSIVAFAVCFRGIGKTNKRLYTLRFDRPAHDTADEAWSWAASYNRAQWPLIGYGLTITAAVPVFFCALISVLTGATRP